ncbi:hypothetical protein F4677DRAFT_410410 [Hypoxylon crocopeplum]|nr:hypothetical protein F4677DRAFT_410410 [Hypoxylon crocopeplum]
MAPNAPRVPLTCASRVAALHLIHPIPALPSSNSVTAIHCRSAGYTLSFEQERYLAGTFAFLAYTRDNNSRIPAVCVEEAPDAAYLNVLLAINQTGWIEGHQVLEELKNGLENIFSPLVQEDGHSSNIEKDVFKAIVTMCWRRIIHRLRLLPNAQGQSIKEALEIALHSLKEIMQRGIKDPEVLLRLRVFIERAREVLKLINSWAKHQTNPRLEELVDGIRHLWQAGDLRPLLDLIPNSDMGPSSRNHLLNMIGKVTTYRYAARFLSRIAKKVPLARRMRVVAVQLPRKAFDRILDNGHTLELAATVSSIDKLKQNEKNLAQICRLLEQTKENAKSRFAKQTRKTLQEAKIHAEVQLLYYCELNVSSTRLPRVVCSSKDACWLCNEFILMYEKIHTPRTHGKLYPGWRLPMSSGPEANIAERYNMRLQDRMREGLKTLFERGRKTVYPDPNESTLLNLPWSTSTLALVPSPKANIIVEDVREVAPPSKDELMHESVLVDDEDSKEPLSEVEVVALATPSTDSQRIDNVPELLSATGTSSEDSSCSEEDLIIQRGEIKARAVKKGKASPLYTAGPLEVQVEYAADPDLQAPHRRRKKLSYSVEWLNPDDASRLRNQGDVPIVELASMDGEIDHNTDTGGCVYISNGDAVMRIFMQPVAVGTS